MEITISFFNWSRFHWFDNLSLLFLRIYELIPLVAWLKGFLTLLLRFPDRSLAFPQQIIHHLGISRSVLSGLPRLKANVNSLSAVILATRDGAIIADFVVCTFFR
jgi:hypothetical protein